MSTTPDTAQLLNALLRIPLDQVEPGPNARGDLGDVTDLASSIRALGMQKPLLVVAAGPDRYQVLDGHRRLAAARLLRLPHVDAVVRRDAGDLIRIQQQLAMHAHAKAFDPIAEAKALHQLMFDYRLTREQIAERLGKSPGWVRDRIALLALPEDHQRSIAAGRTTLREAAALVQGHAAKAASAAATQRRGGKRHCATCTCVGDQ